jgi:predicted TIM-barrel fold metal-dependent hydrolase
MKIDAFTHILPRPYLDRVSALEVNEQTANRRTRASTVRALVDLDERFRQMDAFGDYRQLVNMAGAPVHDFGSPALSRELARLGNESLAELVADHPDRFVGFCACVPLDDPDATVEEYLYARQELGALGAQIHTHVHGRPLDGPEFDPFYAAVAASGGLLQIHPCRTASWPDYPTEESSRYEIWWAFGWEYDLSAFMARIVFSGVLERFPELKLLIHHAGALVPHFAGRVGPGWDQLGMRTPESRKEDVEGYPLTKRPIDYFRQMYVDTALFGATNALRCSLEFYGVDHIVFGSDSPYGPPDHGGYLAPTVESIEALDLGDAERDAIYHGNVTRLLGLPVPA